MSNDFGAKIAELRKERKLTQKQFAEKIGTTSTTVSSWESRGILPTLDIAVRITEAFDVSLDWLCNIDNEKAYKMSTYGDVLRCLSKFAKLDYAGIYVTTDTKNRSIGDIVLEYVNENGEVVEGASLHFYGGKTYGRIVDDWLKLKNLYEKGTISKSMYNLWFEDRCKLLSNYNLGDVDDEKKLNEALSKLSQDD